MKHEHEKYAPSHLTCGSVIRSPALDDALLEVPGLRAQHLPRPAHRHVRLLDEDAAAPALLRMRRPRVCKVTIWLDIRSIVLFICVCCTLHCVRLDICRLEVLVSLSYIYRLFRLWNIYIKSIEIYTSNLQIQIYRYIYWCTLCRL